MTRAYNSDCMEAMSQMSDNEFDLAIVDPPYGIGNTTTSKGNKKRKTLHERVTWNNRIPPDEYFRQIRRVSVNQIIWGCNYFYPHIKETGRIIHFKDPFQTSDKIRFCLADLASQTFDNRIEHFTYNWYGNTQGGKPNFKNTGIDTRIHPTQKPVALYKWLLKKYAKEGDKILDTHLGSGSSRIAAYDMGFDFTGYETDEDYFKAHELRYVNHIRQGSLFEPKEMY